MLCYVIMQKNTTKLNLCSCNIIYAMKFQQITPDRNYHVCDWSCDMCNINHIIKKKKIKLWITAEGQDYDSLTSGAANALLTDKTLHDQHLAPIRNVIFISKSNKLHPWPQLLNKLLIPCDHLRGFGLQDAAKVARMTSGKWVVGEAS